MYKPKAL